MGLWGYESLKQFSLVDKLSFTTATVGVRWSEGLRREGREVR